jgi:uncharacterized protein YndB with AHSA1/START domain
MDIAIPHVLLAGAAMDFTIDVASPIERVFELLADLPHYPQWLPPSGLYATTVVSEIPIRLGATYVDQSKQGPLQGRVTDYQPPHLLGFHQEAQWALGRLTIDIHYQLEDRDGTTRVHRTTAPQMAGALALVGPMVIRSIRRENLRTLARMKQYLETAPA